MANLIVQTSELIPFVETLTYLTGDYSYGEPQELYEYRGKLVMFATTALWHQQALREVDFHTHLGEYLALMIDKPPMTEWIEDWHDHVIPEMLAELKAFIIQDDSPLNGEQLHDLDTSARQLATVCLAAANTDQQLTALHQSYALTRDFFLDYRTTLSVAGQAAIKAMEEWYALR